MTTVPAGERGELVDEYLSDVTHVSLHSSDPSTTGANELAGSSYARAAASFAAAGADDTAENDALITFPTASGAWSEATHFGLWTDVAAGTFKGGAALDTPRTAASGDTIRFAIGALVVQVENGA